ncbi:MAG TPA: xanthine dehydrogenase family protein subunit M [Myxococcaceae bacterium]|nr:xanthine dehydrogenase family protein subunit M [Myxococcaceae bacterium]
MYPVPFEYHRAGTVEEAVALLARYGESGKLLAGGHSLLPLMKLRLAEPRHLVDIRRIPGLSGVREEGGVLVIGAATPHHTLESSPVVRQRLPILSEAAAQIGDVQVRNMGTIGGSLAHADPAADLPAVMVALGAELVAVGPKGKRTLPADGFFVKLFTTVLSPGEVLTEVRIPLPAAGTGGAYAKFPHPASRFAVVGVAAVITVSARKFSAARVAITGVGAKAVRASATEAALTGQAADAKVIAAAAEKAAEGLTVRADPRMDPDYWRALAVTFTRRALTTALGRAGG